MTADALQTVLETPFPAAATMQCPYDYYAALHELPPQRFPTGEFAVARRADILEVTRQPEVFSNHHSVFDNGWMRAATLADDTRTDYPWGLAVSDRPDHTWKRKLAFEMFKPGVLREQESMIRDIVDDLIDGIADRGECEFVGEFATRLTSSVILRLFGLPLEYVDRAIAWGRYEGFGTRWAAPENQQAARDAIVDLGAFIRDRVLERLDDPGDDELSRYVQRHVEFRGGLDLPNLVAESTNLFIGGIITSAHLMSSMLMLFIQHPDQMEKATATRPALKRAVEEGLRIESPTQMIPRLARRDAEVGGVSIAAGSIVLLLYGAANRDPDVFACPERFDVERTDVREHVAFGNGIHFCIGAPLARLEQVVAFEQLFARLANIRFAPGKNDFENHWTPVFRGPRELHIQFERAS